MKRLTKEELELLRHGVESLDDGMRVSLSAHDVAVWDSLYKKVRGERT